MSDHSRSVEETENPFDTPKLLAEKDPDHAFESWAVESVANLARQLLAERDSLLTRVSELEGYEDETTGGIGWEAWLDKVRSNTEAVVRQRDQAESRIESLVGEREELREALAKARNWMGELAHDADQMRMFSDDVATVDAVLSSRETTDTPRTCPDCGKPETENHTEFDGIGWMERSGIGDDVGWKDCATTEGTSE